VSDVLPMDLEAERVVLGAALRSSEMFSRIQPLVDPDDFAAEKHRRIYIAIREVWEAGASVEPFSVSIRLRDNGQLESVGGMGYLVSIDDGMGAILGGEMYATRVRDKAILRRTILECRKMIADCETAGESRDVLERGERVLRDLAAQTAQDRRLVDAGEIIRECGGVDGFMQSTKASVPLPWPPVNDILAGGFRNGEFIVIAAATSVGKTAIASQIAEYAASHGIGTALFSLEMQKRDMLMRIAVLRSRVDGQAVRMNRLGRDQRMEYQRALMEIAEMPLYFDDTSSVTVPAMHAAVRRKMTTHKIGLVIVDYLQLAEAVGKSSTRQEEVGSIARGLKLMAGDFDIPVVGLSQINRAGEAKTEPEVTDLRESGDIGNSANTIIFVWRTDPNALYSDIVPVKVAVKKQRNGPLGYEDMAYHRRWLRFEGMTTEGAAA
jgi:replicative DNA helicase